MTSGTCADKGYGWIEDAATCEAAAGQVGWSDTTADAVSDSDYPQGCSTQNNGGVLYFNTHTSSTRSCDYSYSKACLCAFAGPDCAHDDGTTANPGPCVCGTSGTYCSSATGLVCDTSNNDRCSAVPTCTTTTPTHPHTTPTCA